MVTGSAARAMRLVRWGRLALVAPVLLFAGAAAWLRVSGHPTLAVPSSVLGLLWAGYLLACWQATHSPRIERQDDAHAVPVSPEEQPDLWAVVRDAAGAAGVPAPAELRLTALGGISARLGDRLRLDIGVPLLFVLDPPAVGTLAARALADADSGWVKAAEPVDRFATLVAATARLRPTRPLLHPLHRRLAAHRTRALIDADDVAASVAGPRTAARALGWAHAIRLGTEWWLEELLAPGLALGSAPRPLLPGLESLLCDPARHAALAETVRSQLPTGDGSGIPGLAERVHSLALGADAPPERVGPPAVELLRTPSTVLQRVGEAALGSVDWDRTWPQELEAWAARTAHSSAVILAGHGGTVEPLGEILDGIAVGELPAWVLDVVRDPRANTEELGAFLLGGLLAEALVDGGAGRLRATWAGEIDVVGVDGSPLEVPRAARLLVEDPHLAPDLRSMLTDLGASAEFVPAGAEGGTATRLLAFLRRPGSRRIPGTGFAARIAPS